MDPTPGWTDRLQPLAFTALALTGGALGLWAMTFHPSGDGDWHPLTYQSGFELWRTLIIVQFGLFLPALFWSVTAMSRAIKKSRYERGVYIFSFFALILLFVGFIAPHYIATSGELSPKYHFPLDNHSQRMYIILGFAGAVAVVSSLLLMMTADDFKRIEHRFRNSIAKIDVSSELSLFLEKKSLTSKIMTLLSVMITLGTLATGALARAIDQLATAEGFCEIGVPEEIGQSVCALASDRYITSDNVIAYGLFMTFLLTIVYLPVYWRQVAAGQRIQDHLLGERPVPATESGYDREAWSTYLELRGSLAQFLETSVDAREGLQSKIAILGPLTAGLLTQFLGG